MPTYEFSCKQCDHRFSTFTTISRKSEIRCPQCGAGDLKEFYGVPSIGGSLSSPSAGTGGHSCAGSCSSCGGTCKT
ncbi:zinc ribbon domain-containing protein [bacterium]|nr:zinc ribbon domain-containing protein [bacterium]